MDGRHLLAFIEGVLRERPHLEEALDGLYDEATPPATPEPVTRDERNAEIQLALRLFS